jgi:hypothetical protein
MRKLAPVPLLLLLLGLFSDANAGQHMFGTKDSIHVVADTNIPGPGTSRLYLGHRVTTHAFLLPYYVESNGLVFGISGDPKKYIPLPSQEQLAKFQKAGLLPNELPKVELGFFDYLVGYSLELSLLGWVGYTLIRSKLAARRG